jgi:transcription-repair coupling factor (superfamily II helicase)
VSLQGLNESLDRYPPIIRIAELAADSAAELIDVHALAAAHPLVVAAIRRSSDAPVLLLTATGSGADSLAASLSDFLPDSRIATFPSWETLPHERLSPSLDTVGRRTRVLRRLAHPNEDDELLEPIDIVVASIRAALQPVMRAVAEAEPVRLRAGDAAVLTDVVDRLVELGYERVDLVERRGQVAVRGGIVDVFPSTEEHAVRVEFWGDEVDGIRYFVVADQRSLETVPHGLLATPVRELLLTDEVRSRARELATHIPGIADMCGQIAEGVAVEGMESLSALFDSQMTTLVEYLPRGSQVAVSEPERVSSRAADVLRTAEEFLEAGWHSAAVGADVPIDIELAAYRTLPELQAIAVARGCGWWELNPLRSPDPDVDLGASAPEDYRGEAEAAFSDFRGWLAEGRTVVVTANGKGPLERLAEEMAAVDLPARVEDHPDLGSPGVVHLVRSHLVRGFVLPELAVVTETDLLGQRSAGRDTSKLPSRRRKTIDPLTLKAGDFVVHEQHGVGKYVEMIRRTVQGAEREYMIIEYAPSKRGQPADRLFLPMDQLDLITRYVGGESPSLHRLGGSDWAKTKGRARKAVRQIAGELVRLYAARQASTGHAFASDTPWQGELEDAFEYVETPDQLACIDEVKRDMERITPMDRLICGDVGYGKTEIAVRAAFKAVQDGKQVAFLVPTTLLVQQHLSTLSERYAAFPIRVAALSRFTSDKNRKEVLQGITDGSVDIVIGTHRLLTPEVRFKDLGLVIVDEEQRFGVEHKEHLKALRANVDVLAMSATPIPRTLEMAVTGIREMSVIQTPPEERHPVLTYVGPYDDKQITAAIRRELLRDGQVFFVHNRVESIDRAATRVQDLVPEARIAVAHGQMPESRLEQVIVDFWNKDIDILVCTTIVESGIDIANANTLIVDRADTFGLSQLHQLRGRVGRSRERAYAYLLYDPNKPLTETAHERLATIAQRTDLGSGMQIALKDLEIRGAGNLLGGEQSGHIADVGFDLYVRLVGEALAEHKAGTGDGETEVAEVKVELPITAHIPEAYVPAERLRLEAYKRLADAHTEDQVDEVAAELVDRYGPLPVETQTLVAVARFRVHCREAGIEEVIAQGNGIRLHPVELPESAQMRITRLYPRTTVKPAVRTIIVPRPTAGTAIGAAPLKDHDLLTWADDLVQAVRGVPVQRKDADT